MSLFGHRLFKSVLDFVALIWGLGVPILNNHLNAVWVSGHNAQLANRACLLLIWALVLYIFGIH